MDDIPEAGGPDAPVQGPADLRFLKRLVTVLTATMIAGLLAIVALIVIRFGAVPGPALPEALALPEGVRAEAVTAGRGWYAVVTEDQRLMIFGADGTLRRTVEIAP
jgi:hypothetical protein